MGAEAIGKREGLLAVHESLVANLKIAQAMVKFEGLFRTIGTQEVGSADVIALLSEMPEKYQGRFKSALGKYDELLQNAQKCKEIMDAEMVNYMKQGWHVLKNEKRGHKAFNRQVFREIAGVDPEGWVSVDIRGPYLFISCDLERDYVELYAEGKSYLRSVDRARRGQACYTSTHRLKIFQETPIPIVKYKKIAWKTKTFTPALAEDHEMQHFMNAEIFDNFKKTEETVERTKELIDYEYSVLFGDQRSGEEYQRILRPNRFQGVKDELLATVRDAFENERFTKIHEHPAYSGLYSDLDTAESTTAVQAAQVLAKFMEKWGYYTVDNPSSPSRAELIYRLALVKLENWPKWLELMDHYDGHRKKKQDIEHAPLA